MMTRRQAAFLLAIALRGASCYNETTMSTSSACAAATGRRMVFCVHGGRAGSAFLATLSAMLPNTTARHEHALTGESFTSATLQQDTVRGSIME